MFKNIYTPVAAIIISVLLGYFVIMPDLASLKKAKLELAEKKALSKKMMKVDELIKQKNAEYEKNFLLRLVKGEDGKMHPDKSDPYYKEKEIFPLIVKRQIDEIRLLINIYGLAKVATDEGYYVAAGEFDKVTMPKDDTQAVSGDGFFEAGDENGGGAGGSDKLLEDGEVSFTFSATYDDFQEFLRIVEKNANLLDVVKISFANQEGGGDDGESEAGGGETGSTASKEVDENTIYDFKVTFKTYQLVK